MFLHECRCKTFCGTRVVFTNHAPKFSSSLSSGLLERFFWAIIWFFVIEENNIIIEAELFSLDGSKRFYEKKIVKIEKFKEIGKEIGQILKTKSNNSYKR